MGLGASRQSQSVGAPSLDGRGAALYLSVSPSAAVDSRKNELTALISHKHAESHLLIS
jgi:hypothetical protein